MPRSGATQVEGLNDSLDKRSAFDAPADGALSERQFNRFMAAQRRVRNEIEGGLDELQQRYESMQEQIDERGGQAGVGEMMGACSDLTDLLIEVKRAHVAALNAQGFSLHKYNGHAGRSTALGESVAVAAIAETGGVTQMQTRVPDATRGMIPTHREDLMESCGLA